MAFMNLPWDKALRYVKERRKMAQPNPGFLKLLARLNSDENFFSFSKELSSN